MMLIYAIPPGEILMEEFMKPMGISINGLARDIDVPPNRISEILKGKRAITADTALRLGKYFGVSPEIWLDLQTNYGLRVMRRRAWPDLCRWGLPSPGRGLPHRQPAPLRATAESRRWHRSLRQHVGIRIGG